MGKSIKAVQKIALCLGEEQITGYDFDNILYKNKYIIVLHAKDTIFIYDVKTGNKLFEIKNVENYHIYDNVIIIVVGGLYGAYSIKGEWLLPCEYTGIAVEYLTKFGDMRVIKDGKMGVYSISRKRFIIPIMYDDISCWHGYYLVKNNGAEGLYSPNGKKIIQPSKYKWVEITGVPNYFFVMNNEGLFGLFYGRKKILPCEYIDISTSEVHGVLKIMKEDDKEKYFVTGDNKIIEADDVDKDIKKGIMFLKDKKWYKYSELK